MKTLVIGIGNTIRCDDGVGFKLASQIQEHALENVDVIYTHQLLPELSEDISKYEVAVFIDASMELECGKIAFKELLPKDIEEIDTHHLTPETLLELSYDFYDAKPTAYSVHIGLCSDELKEELSPTLQTSFDSYKLQIVNFLKTL